MATVATPAPANDSVNRPTPLQTTPTPATTTSANATNTTTTTTTTTTYAGSTNSTSGPNNNSSSSSELDEQIERLKRCEYLREGEVKALCLRAREILVDESNVQRVDAPVTVSVSFLDADGYKMHTPAFLIFQILKFLFEIDT